MNPVLIHAFIDELEKTSALEKEALRGRTIGGLALIGAAGLLGGVAGYKALTRNVGKKKKKGPVVPKPVPGNPLYTIKGDMSDAPWHPEYGGYVDIFDGAIGGDFSMSDLSEIGKREVRKVEKDWRGYGGIPNAAVYAIAQNLKIPQSAMWKGGKHPTMTPGHRFEMKRGGWVRSEDARYPQSPLNRTPK